MCLSQVRQEVEKHLRPLAFQQVRLLSYRTWYLVESWTNLCQFQYCPGQLASCQFLTNWLCSCRSPLLSVYADMSTTCKVSFMSCSDTSELSPSKQCKLLHSGARFYRESQCVVKTILVTADSQDSFIFTCLMFFSGLRTRDCVLLL